MRISKGKKAERFLSLLLAVVMIVGMLPATVFARASKSPGMFTVEVTDEESGEAIENATIKYFVRKAAGELTSSGTKNTDDEGKIYINLSEYSEYLSKGGKLYFAYRINASGYTGNEGEIRIVDVEYNLHVKMRPNSKGGLLYNITVHQTPSGRGGNVRLEGMSGLSANALEGESVEYVIIPEEHWYIQSLKIGDDDLTDTLTHGEPAVGSFTPFGDTDIYVTFQEEYTVTASPNPGGTITVDGAGGKMIAAGSEVFKKYDKDTDLSVNVKPNDGYRIMSVTIGGSDETVSDPYSFTKDSIKLTEDLTISAVFALEYTVTVTFDDNGTVTTEPSGETEAGKVTAKVISRDSVKLTATANEHYRVAGVHYEGTFTGSDQANENFVDNTYANKGGGEVTPYEKTISGISSDVSVSVTFAKVILNVTVEDPDPDEKHGTVAVEDAHVNYGEGTVATVTIEGDFNIDKVTLNGAEYSLFYYAGDLTCNIRLSNIIEDTVIKVTYKTMEPDESDVLPADVTGYKEGAVRVDESAGDGSPYIYVFSKDGKPYFGTDKEGIAINSLTSDGSRYKSNRLDITETQEADSIYIFDEAMPGWRKYTPKNPIRVVIDKDAPKAEFVEEQNKENHYFGGYYNGDFHVTVTATDADVPQKTDWSGISRVEYKITADGQDIDLDSNPATEWIALYDYKVKITEGIKSEVEGTINVPVGDKGINSDEVVIHVRLTDLAGNVIETNSDALKVRPTPPVIEQVSIDGEKSDEAEEDYYNGADGIKAVITVTDGAFNKENFKNAIKIEKWIGDSASGSYQDATEGDYDLEWSEDAGSASHTVTVIFRNDGTYRLSIGKYVNNAGKEAERSEELVETTTWEFTLDTTAPKARFDSNGNFWSDLRETLTFGLWKNKDKITFEAEAEDETAGIKEDKGILYYLQEFKPNDANWKDLEPEQLTLDELQEKYREDIEDEKEEKNFTSEKPTVISDGVYVVYARIADKAGNVTYISSEGLIYDTTAPENGITIEFAPKLQEDEGPSVYSSDVKVTVRVDETERANAVSSGIKSIDYRVFNSKNSYESDTEPTQSGNLYTFEYGDDTTDGHPTYDELKFSFNTASDPEDDSRGKFTVEAEKNNTGEVYVAVTVTDNAGNSYTKVEGPKKIFTGKPTASITFNEDDETYNENRHDATYFTSRKATVTVTEPDYVFNAENATGGIKISAANNEGTLTLENKDYEISGWQHGENGEDTGENGEDTNTHVATVTFNKDAKYKVYVDYTDNAGKRVNTEEDAQKFTLDKTDPTGKVTVGGSFWTTLLENLTFGLWKAEKTDIVLEANDVTSNTSIDYYIDRYEGDPGDAHLDANVLDNLDATKWKPYLPPLGEENDGAFTVYERVTDYAGNRCYVSSDGYIIDKVGCIITVENEDTYSGHVFNDDVTVTFTVKDGEKGGIYSGIKDVSYTLTSKDANASKEAALFNFDYVRSVDETTGEDRNGGSLKVKGGEESEPADKGSGNVPKYSDLVHCKEFNVRVDAETFNARDIKLTIVAHDNAGNKTEKTLNLQIDTDAPVVEVAFPEDDIPVKDKYFNKERTATVTITDADKEIDSTRLNITVDAKDAYDKAVLGDEQHHVYDVGEWSKQELGNGINIFTAKVTFHADANYKFEVVYKDDAGHANSDMITSGSCPTEFTIDTTEPVIGESDGDYPTSTVTATASYKDVEGKDTDEKRTETWNSLRDTLNFGFWSNDEINVDVSPADITSPIDKVEYHIDTIESGGAATAMTREQLERESDWRSLAKLSEDLTKSSEDGKGAIWGNATINTDSRFVVYIKITDMAGWSSYISTDGLILDKQKAELDIFSPVITLEPAREPKNGIYKDGDEIGIKVAVTDPAEGRNGRFSGLKGVTYRVVNRKTGQNNPTQQGTLYTFSSAHSTPTWEDLLAAAHWEPDNGDGVAFKVDSILNNSNEIIVEVTAEDNAGNITTETLPLMIDITAPKIAVSYDNNNFSADGFFSASRKATVTVTERNFDQNAVEVSVTNSKGVIPVLSAWKQISKGTGNGDDATWAATILYDAEGDYTFDVTCTDLAGNEMEDRVNYGDSASPTKFTIDKTFAVISVRYNNNDVSHDKYFKAPRTATVEITEHNFSVDRVAFTITAALDGKPVAVPGASWTHNDDVHTATIVYTEDADYSFKVTVTDLAGNLTGAVNYGDSKAPEDFTVDKTIAKPVITGVANGSSYREEAVPNISFSDVNYDSYEVLLTRTRKDEIGVDVTSQFIDRIEVNEKGGARSFDTFERKVENDGIYTLTVGMEDKAGNKGSQSVTFTVNRFGSVYEYGDYLVSLIKGGGAYVEAVDDDLVLTEYNPNRLIADSLNIEITLDGRSIEAKYSADPVPNESVGVGESGWYQYRYAISKDNFTDDGIYRITLSSKDEAQNTPESTPDNSTDEKGKSVVDTIQFRVDDTPPEITNITGLEKKIINEQSVDVKYTVYDAIGLKSVTVYLDGGKADTVTEFDDMNNFSGTFTISEDSAEQAVRILVEDKAGNTTDTDRFGKKDEDGNAVPMPTYAFNGTVTVSTNFFVRWYANKPLFWGSVGGFLGLALIILIIILLIKRKKEDEEERQ